MLLFFMQFLGVLVVILPILTIFVAQNEQDTLLETIPLEAEEQSNS